MSPSSAQETQARSLRDDVKKPVVLIVEDEAVVARDLQRSLADMGYDVLPCAASGEEALHLAEERAPDVVLMDIRIQGDADGIATAQLLRRRYRVPIIYLTAYADDETVARAAHSEPYGYLIKPFTKREVRIAIEVARHKFALDMQLAERERWFSTTLRSIGDAVVACNAEQQVQFMNRAAEELTGWTEREACGRAISEVVRFVSRDEQAAVPALIERALRERRVLSVPDDTQLLSRDGSPCAIDDATAPIVAGDALLGAVVVFRDITQQQRLREQVATTERLAALGTLAAGVCHEINNPLTFIIANAHFLETAIESWQHQLRQQGSIELADRTWRAKEALDDLREGAERIRRIVSDLSLFGRPVDEPPPVIELRASVDWAVRVAANQVRPRARLIEELHPAPKVRASETRLAQVLINLLVNAAHAIPEGDAEDHTIAITTGTDAQGRAVIGVRDTGCGIPRDLLPRIFDPFFTTKHPGVSPGLGLSICHGIVEMLGGEIQVQSEEGKGSLFEVFLPAATAHTDDASIAPLPALPVRRGRVLVVDDEPSFLRAVKALLGDDHEVIATADASEALCMIERGPGFDVVLCDVLMPGFGGMDLYRRVIAGAPELAARFVFVTGGAFTPRSTAFLAEVRNPRIQKPFSPAELQDLVQWLLHAREPVLRVVSR